MNGHLHSPDFRIWFPSSFCIADPEKFPCLAGGRELCGAGLKRVQSEPATFAAEGITETKINKEATKIYAALDLPLRQLWTPKLIQSIQNSWTALALAWIREKLGADNYAAGILWDDGHWVSFQAFWHDDRVECQFFDGLRDGVSAEMHRFATRLAQARDIFDVRTETRRVVTQTHGHHCGAIALMHLQFCLGVTGPFTEEIAVNWHREIVDDPGFLCTHMESQSTVSSTWEWQLTGSGPSASQINELASLLCEKGVPQQISHQRAGEVIGKLGGAVVSHALRAENPWQVLKASANAPATRMRLVHEDEQKAFIEQKASNRFGASIDKHKQKKQHRNNEKKTEAITLDPNLLMIEASHFVDGQGKEVPIITYEEIAAGMRGIALSSCGKAKNFIDDPRSISQDALAVVLADLPPEEIIDATKVAKLRFPAMYVGTKEHIIVFGGILNLGDVEVKRKVVNQKLSTDAIKTAVLKILLVRDQVQMHWEDITKAPIKALLQLLPALCFCEGKNCGQDCNKSHQILGENYDSIILELWSRMFSLSKGGKTRPEQADQFLVYARVPEVTIEKVISHSVPGLYIEPRLDGEKGHHPAFRVVWLNRVDHASALHQSRTCPFSMGLVKLKDRYGLRVRQKDEEMAWNLLRPDDDYKDVLVKEVYEVAPFDHGTTKAAVEQVLDAWGWKAKVLSPGRGASSHMSWRIGASSPPSSMVFASEGRDIIANPVKQTKEWKAPQVAIASWKTKSHIWKGGSAETSQSSTDPLIANDPWANYKAPASQTKQNTERTYLSEVSDALQKKIQDEVNKQCAQFREQADHQMEDDDGDMQMLALQSAVQELQAQNGECRQWIQEAASKIQQVEAATKETQQVMQCQQQEIQSLKAEIQQTAASTGNMVQQALGTVKRELIAELSEANSKHFAQLEALMSKKMRQE